MDDFVHEIGAYVNRVERLHWRRTGLFSRTVVDAIVPLCQAYAAGADAALLYLAVQDLCATLRALGVPPGCRARAAAAVADDLDLALLAWLPQPDLGVRDPLLARAFRSAEPLDRDDLDPVPATAVGAAA
ncbi:MULTISPECIES: hypothetical protein [unclassified Cellulosimicrobium]|uniref:Uncharacterized protein n=1 Tax=Cellulosimicrobium sp. ES-005 TaxID=3163031 RepID=A0AAU8FWD5_9MICO|nr:hypothetical protein [Cellulosimicrobium cellulans]